MAASVALHVVIAGVLLVQLPPLDFTPPQEETVTVEMVPPPEKETEPDLNLTVPEKTSEDEQAAMPPAEEQKPAEEEAGGPEKAPETAAEEAPPPPPPTQAAAPEQIEPAPEDPEQPAPQPSEAETAEAAPPAGEGEMPAMLRPVFEFGEENKGSAAATDGNASEGEEGQAEQAEETTQAADAAADAEQDAAADGDAQGENSAAAGATEEAEAGGSPDAASGVALPQDIAPPEVDGAVVGAMPSEALGGGMAEGTAMVPEQPAGQVGEGEVAVPVARPVQKPTERPLRPARRLFSRTDTEDPMAMAAMEGVPRDVRAGQLCSSELYGQLLYGERRMRPDALPSLRLADGNVLEASDAAFRFDGEWYDVRFRCEINDGATQVVSFAFEIGDPVPRSQWRARGFGDFR